MSPEPIPSADPVTLAIQAGLQIAKIAGFDPIGDTIGKLFGGDGHHDVNLPALSVQDNISDLGVLTTPINVSRFRYLGGTSGALNVRTESVLVAIREIQSTLGHLSVEFSDTPAGNAFAVLNKELSTRALAMNFAASPSDAVRRQQLAVNAVSNATTVLDVFNKLRLLDQSRKAVAPIVNPTTPFTRGAPQNINVIIPPVKVVIQQPQSTLGQSNYPQFQTQLANPQTKANWWQSLKQKVNIAGNVARAIQFPFFIRDTFFSGDGGEALQSLFFGESGDVFFPEFPEQQPQPEFISYLNPTAQPFDANFQIEELKNDSIFAQLSPTAKTLLPLLLGLIITYAVLKKRGLK